MLRATRTGLVFIDTLKETKAELEKLGVEVKVFENSVTVSGGATVPRAELCGHNDHRIVMALSILLTHFGGVINGCEAVSKSYPGFFEDIAKLGIRSFILK